MIQSRFHWFSRVFTVVFRHEKRIVPMQEPCNDRLMHGRFIPLALLATAACMSAPGQTTNSGFSDPEQLRRFLDGWLSQTPQFAASRPVFNLNGSWASEDVLIWIEQKGTNIAISDITRSSPYKDKTLFRGDYEGETTVPLKWNPEVTPKPAKDFTMSIDGPDRITMSNGFVYDRFSAPKLNDIPCDAANPLRVTAKGASARADVAADAKDMPTAFCWLSVSASLGDIKAEYQTALWLYGGLGTEKNYESAFYWMNKSAQQHYLEAEQTLASMYIKGVGTPADPARGAYWLGIWKRHLAEQQEGPSLLQGMDSVQGALDTVFGGESYPGQKCGWSYTAYLHFKPQNPCAGR
jgi:hypothetical protein